MKVTSKDIEWMIAEQKSFYFSGQTKNIDFRKRQLLTLKKTIKNMKMKY